MKTSSFLPWAVAAIAAGVVITAGIALRTIIHSPELLISHEND